jgi:hypothetical protein
MIPTQKTKCASRAQMLDFAPYLLLAHLGRAQAAKLVWCAFKCALGLQTPILSAHLACELRTSLAKCASRVQAKCALKSAPDRLVRTTLAPDLTKPTLLKEILHKQLIH